MGTLADTADTERCSLATSILMKKMAKIDSERLGYDGFCAGRRPEKCPSFVALQKAELASCLLSNNRQSGVPDATGGHVASFPNGMNDPSLSGTSGVSEAAGADVSLDDYRNGGQGKAVKAKRRVKSMFKRMTAL
jgi:hypothetical protein